MGYAELVNLTHCTGAADLDPPSTPERSINDVQIELMEVTNEIRSIELRMDFLRDQEWKLQNELRALQTPLSKRDPRNIENEKRFKENFVMAETLSDVFDI